jgi:hypothetical protein
MSMVNVIDYGQYDAWPYPNGVGCCRYGCGRSATQTDGSCGLCSPHNVTVSDNLARFTWRAEKSRRDMLKDVLR